MDKNIPAAGGELPAVMLSIVKDSRDEGKSGLETASGSSEDASDADRVPTHVPTSEAADKRDSTPSTHRRGSPIPSLAAEGCRDRCWTDAGLRYE